MATVDQEGRGLIRTVVLKTAAALVHPCLFLIHKYQQLFTFIRTPPLQSPSLVWEEKQGCGGRWGIVIDL